MVACAFAVPSREVQRIGVLIEVSRSLIGGQFLPPEPMRGEHVVGVTAATTAAVGVAASIYLQLSEELVGF